MQRSSVEQDEVVIRMAKRRGRVIARNFYYLWGKCGKLILTTLIINEVISFFEILYVMPLN